MPELSRDQEAIDELIDEVPQELQKAYQQVMENICDWYGDKAYRKVADWHECLKPLWENNAS